MRAIRGSTPIEPYAKVPCQLSILIKPYTKSVRYLWILALAVTDC